MRRDKQSTSDPCLKDTVAGLLERIASREALVGVIGLGYVGLPLVIRFCEGGFRVKGFDTDPKKVELLERGVSYIRHISNERLSKFITSNPPLFTATTDMSRLSEMDAIIICVPTPLNDNREPDLQYVENAAKDIASNLRAGQLIVLESTTYPGTTEELLLPLLEREGLKVGRDFFLVFSPEREDPGRKDYTTYNTPKLVGGVTPQCLKVGSFFYSQVVKRVVEVSSPKVAEMAKLLENIYRCVNIALINELKILCNRMDIDIWEVIEAAKTKPFGFEPFYPGPGLGGHCIPIDPFYLTWKAREYHYVTKFIELAGEINTNMPYYVVQRVMEALNGHGKPLKGSKILVLGVAYKKDIDDVRESPAIPIIQLLKERGAIVSYNDPYVPEAVSQRKGFRMVSKELTEEILRESDCVIITTDHSLYDYRWIVEKSSLIVDTRNATRGIKSDKIVKA